MNILFLDDDMERHKYFNKWIPSGHFVAEVNNYESTITLLNIKDKNFYDIMFLDHDLGVEDQMCTPGVNNRYKTGTDVAQFIVENDIRPNKFVVLHSYNPVGVQRMLKILSTAGIKVVCHPFGKNLTQFL